MKVSTYDVSTARRIKEVLNTLRYGSVALGGILVLVALAVPKLLPVMVVYLLASIYVARGRWLAPLALACIWIAAALYVNHDYRDARARFDARVESGVRDESTGPGSLSLIESSRYLAWACVGLAAVFGATIPLSVVYARMSVRPAMELDRPRWLALRLKLLYAGTTPTAALLFGLSVACALIALSPGLLVLLHLALFKWEIGWLIAAAEWGEPRVLIVPIPFVFGFLSCTLFTRAKRRASVPVSTARSIDMRPPVLLLRSFLDDTTPLARTTDQSAWVRRLVAPKMWTLEETIERLLTPYGPLIAIGRPGESSSPPGAAREYVPNDKWRARIEEHIREARAIVVILGKTEGLELEYRTLASLGALTKLVIIFPPVDGADIADRWSRFCNVALSDSDVLRARDMSRVLAACFTETGTMAVVTCRRRDDEDCYRLGLDRCLATALRPPLQPA